MQLSFRVRVTPGRAQPAAAWKHAPQRLVTVEGMVWITELREAGPRWTLLCRKG